MKFHDLRVIKKINKNYLKSWLLVQNLKIVLIKMFISSKLLISCDSVKKNPPNKERKNSDRTNCDGELQFLKPYEYLWKKFHTFVKKKIFFK